MVRGSPHPQAARRLIDYLLSPAVEIALAEGPSAQIPLGAKVRVKLPRGDAADSPADAGRFLRRRGKMGRRRRFPPRSVRRRVE